MKTSFDEDAAVPKSNSRSRWMSRFLRRADNTDRLVVLGMKRQPIGLRASRRLRGPHLSERAEDVHPIDFEHAPARLPVPPDRATLGSARGEVRVRIPERAEM